MTILADREGAAPEVSGELVPYSPATMEEYRPRIVMAPDEARALDEALRENMRAVLREDVDFGVIPGTGSKPTLLKPGAEKLLQWFGFGHTMQRVEIERDMEGKRVGVTYCCTVTKGMPDGRVVVVATCEGYAGYDEDRFYLSAADATAKERANAERYRRSVNQSKCVEYRAPWNSVIKMAQKRALVGAALQATSASTLFTQDVEDTAADVTPASAVADVAVPVVKALPEGTQKALTRWYRDQGWGAPTAWSVEQWCAALVQAGRLDATPVPPAETPVGAEPPGNAAWLQSILDRGRSATEDTYKALWKELADGAQESRCTPAEQKRAEAVIRERIDSLRKAQPLDPIDPWVLKAQEITTPEDGATLTEEIRKAFAAKDLDETRANALLVLVAEKTAEVAG